MTSEKLKEIIKNILRTAELEDTLSVSEHTNQLADFMIYQKPSSAESLAVGGEPLVQVYDITNILFKYGG